MARSGLVEPGDHSSNLSPFIPVELWVDASVLVHGPKPGNLPKSAQTPVLGQRPSVLKESAKSLAQNSFHHGLKSFDRSASWAHVQEVQTFFGGRGDESNSQNGNPKGRVQKYP